MNAPSVVVTSLNPCPVPRLQCWSSWDPGAAGGGSSPFGLEEPRTGAGLQDEAGPCPLSKMAAEGKEHPASPPPALLGLGARSSPTGASLCWARASGALCSLQGKECGRAGGWRGTIIALFFLKIYQCQNQSEQRMHIFKLKVIKNVLPEKCMMDSM